MYYRKQETDAAYKAQVNEAAKEACGDRLKIVGKVRAAKKKARKDK